MKSNQINNRFGQNWSEICAKVFGIGKIWLDLGKIKILHPQKYSISYGYASG